MTKFNFALGLLLFAQLVSITPSLAEDFLSEPEPERDLASVPSSTVNAKRSYPGGADEENLEVQATVPEAALHTDARSLQREVYKQLYNQELKDDRQDAVEE